MFLGNIHVSYRQDNTIRILLALNEYQIIFLTFYLFCKKYFIEDFMRIRTGKKHKGKNSNSYLVLFSQRMSKELYRIDRALVPSFIQLINGRSESRDATVTTITQNSKYPSFSKKKNISLYPKLVTYLAYWEICLFSKTGIFHVLSECRCISWYKLPVINKIWLNLSNELWKACIVVLTYGARKDP
jgi:hypothetical protein